MAKKLAIFELVKGAFEIVQSAIYTLKLDVAGSDRPVEIDKADLIDPVNRVKANGTNNYRFKSVVPVPVMAPVTTIAELTDQIGKLAAMVEQYDAADQIRTTDGRLIDRKVHIVPRKINDDGSISNEPNMPTPAYIAMLVRNAMRLDVQKDMQAPLRAEAERVIRDEKSLVAPATKVRARKTKDGSVYDPEQELS